MAGWLFERSARQAAAGLVLVAVAALAFSGCESTSTGQWAADVYGGPNFPVDEDVKVSLGANSTQGNANWHGKATVGARGGRWFPIFEYLDAGLFFDVSGMWQDLGPLELTSVPMTLLPMARIPLIKSEEFPCGRLHPYVGVGPSLFWTDMEAAGLSASSWDVGLDMRAGLSFMILDWMGLFAEYRLTFFQPTFTDFVPGVGDFRLEADARANQALFGLGFRF